MSSSRDRSRFGLGTTSIGGMFAPMSAADAQALMRAAYERGIRWFDTAPMYGASTAERRLGHFLDDLGSTEGLTVSTKAGRLLVPRQRASASAPFNEFGWHNAGPFIEVFDYSYDGIMRSAEDSLARLGIEAFDVLFLHDIGRWTHGAENDRHVAALRAGGYRALAELKATGVTRELGVGVNETDALLSTMAELDLDRALLANQFTLLTRPDDPAVFETCARSGVKLVAGGVYNSGVLAGGSHFSYEGVPDEIARTVAALSETCERHGVPLMAAALQFVLRSGHFERVLLGVRSIAELDASLSAAEVDIPDALWDDLVESGLLEPQWIAGTEVTA